jgi:hypothetical protein
MRLINHRTAHVQQVRIDHAASSELTTLFATFVTNMPSGHPR